MGRWYRQAFCVWLVLALIAAPVRPIFAAISDAEREADTAAYTIVDTIVDTEADIIADAIVDIAADIDGSANAYGTANSFAMAEVALPIANRADLEAIWDDLGGQYYLTGDIDLSDAPWTPIGDGTSTSRRFSGSLDGQGFSITNCTIAGDGAGYYGLFGYADGAEIVNLSVEGGHISVTGSGDIYIGGLVAYAANTDIVNCSNSANISVSAGTGNVFAGGICGNGNYAAISDCYNAGAVTANCTASTIVAGGICGAGASISRCVNTADVQASNDRSATTGSAAAGGICGRASDYTLDVDACDNSGIVYAFANNAYAGGIIGSFSCTSDSDIRDCDNIGAITASARYDANAGGICGFFGSRTLDYVSQISRCRNDGPVDASADDNRTAYAGGIFGYSYVVDVSDCANTGDIAAYAGDANAGGIGGYITGDLFISGVMNSLRGIILRCANSGSVSATPAGFAEIAYAGGILGCLVDPTNPMHAVDKTTVIRNCESEGMAVGTRVGGVLGGIEGTATMDACISYDTVLALAGFSGAYTGGMAGFADGGSMVAFLPGCFYASTGLDPVGGLGLGASLLWTYNIEHPSSAIQFDALAYAGTIGDLIPLVCVLTSPTISTALDTLTWTCSSPYGIGFGEMDVSVAGDEATIHMSLKCLRVGTYIITASTADKAVAKATVEVQWLWPGYGQWDVSGDGKIGMDDVMWIYQYCRGRAEMTGDQLLLADVNGDGAVNLQDALLVYQYCCARI